MHDLRITKDEELPNNIGSMMAEEAGIDAGALLVGSPWKVKANGVGFTFSVQSTCASQKASPS